MVIVQSLWVGNDLSDMEKYSIQSFLNLGHEFHLYTYENIGGIPKGVKIKDGNEIMPAAEIFSLKKTLLPFSDIFRYKMLYEKGNYWVDLDLICIKKLDFKDEFVFSSERTIQKGAYKMKVKYVPNIGVLKAPAKSAFYKELYEKCIAHQKKGINKDKIKYMRILREVIDKYGYMKYVKTPDYFCHLDWWYAKDAFLPLEKYREKYGVKGKTIKEMFYGKNVYTIHLWRNLVTHKYNLDTNGKYDPSTLWERQKRFVDNGSKFPVDMSVPRDRNNTKIISKSTRTMKTKSARRRPKQRSKVRKQQ